MGYYLAYRRVSDKKKHAHICFSEQFRELFDFDLFIYLDKDLSKKVNLDHKVILDNKDINLFIRTIKQEFGGITKVINKTHRGNVVKSKFFSNDRKVNDLIKTKEVRVEFGKCKSNETFSKVVVYKIVCTYLRYLYEGDFTHILKRAIDAYRKNKNIHLFTYLYHAHKNNAYNTGHSIIRHLENSENFKFLPLDKEYANDPLIRGVHDLSQLHRRSEKLSDKEYKLVKELIKW